MRTCAQGRTWGDELSGRGKNYGSSQEVAGFGNESGRSELRKESISEHGERKLKIKRLELYIWR